MATVHDSVASVELTVQPGTTEIHWHPPYSYAQGEAFVARLREAPWTMVERLGSSDEGRNLWLVRISDDRVQPEGRPKQPFLIRARVHAYESAGSYAMEGMVRFLLGDSSWAAAARRVYEFFIIPMANPDGVHNGMGRLTAPRGADLVLAHPITGQTHATLMEAVHRVRPVQFVDLHNWQDKYADGLLGMAPGRRERFFRYMPSLSHHGKRWLVREPVPIAEPAPARELLGVYCRRTFGAQSVTFELPWFGRSPEDMRWVGERALWALLVADGEPDEPPNRGAWL
jgi:hypothetical protein